MRKWYCQDAAGLVRVALARLGAAERAPLAPDTTNRVFLEIESDSALRRRYDALIEDGRKDVINNTIGWEVIVQTGAKKVGVGRQNHSGLITAYGILKRE